MRKSSAILNLESTCVCSIAMGIVFNYPGVGASSGLPSRGAMQKAPESHPSLSEDKEKGIGASEIICFGQSIGAAIQADALKDHPFIKGIRYVIVESRTFSDMSQIILLWRYALEFPRQSSGMEYSCGGCFQKTSSSRNHPTICKGERVPRVR